MKIIQKAIKILEKLEKEKTEDVNKADSKRMTRDGDALVRSADKEAPLAPPAERTKAKFKLGSEEIELPDFGEKEDMGRFLGDIPKIERFLERELGCKLYPNKQYSQDSENFFEFVGMRIKNG